MHTFMSPCSSTGGHQSHRASQTSARTQHRSSELGCAVLERELRSHMALANSTTTATRICTHIWPSNTPAGSTGHALSLSIFPAPTPREVIVTAGAKRVLTPAQPCL